MVLPFDRGEFVRTSLAPAGEAWTRRFEQCLAQATGVVTAEGGEYLDDPTLFDFCARLAMGDAQVRAGFLEADALEVAVWDGSDPAGPAGTAVDVATWRASGKETVVIPVGGGASDPPGDRSSSSRRQIRRSSSPTSPATRGSPTRSSSGSRTM